jgi:hypothetical protein
LTIAATLLEIQRQSRPAVPIVLQTVSGAVLTAIATPRLPTPCRLDTIALACNSSTNSRQRHQWLLTDNPDITTPDSINGIPIYPQRGTLAVGETRDLWLHILTSLTLTPRRHITTATPYLIWRFDGPPAGVQWTCHLTLTPLE